MLIINLLTPAGPRVPQCSCVQHLWPAWVRASTTTLCFSCAAAGGCRPKFDGQEVAGLAVHLSFPLPAVIVNMQEVFVLHRRSHFWWLIRFLLGAGTFRGSARPWPQGWVAWCPAHSSAITASSQGKFFRCLPQISPFLMLELESIPLRQCTTWIMLCPFAWPLTWLFALADTLRLSAATRKPARTATSRATLRGSARSTLSATRAAR